MGLNTSQAILNGVKNLVLLGPFQLVQHNLMSPSLLKIGLRIHILALWAIGHISLRGKEWRGSIRKLHVKNSFEGLVLGRINWWSHLCAYLNHSFGVWTSKPGCKFRVQLWVYCL